jgi:starch synthase (maltosyl-transferring)
MQVKENARRTEALDRRPREGPPPRVVIENVQPCIDGGRFAVKRAVGEQVRVTADLFADGHDALSAALLYRRVGDPQWVETPMTELGNDRWEGIFAVRSVGAYIFTVSGWVDHLKSWRRDFAKKVAAGQHTALDLLAGAELIQGAASRARGADAQALHSWANSVRALASNLDGAGSAVSEDLAHLADKYPDRRHAALFSAELPVWVDREKARFSAWYEMFPRSAAGNERHGTLRDCENWLNYIAGMGFDVLYLPPIHPIGRTKRKGRNNSSVSSEAEPGSPWAIGAAEGGHKTIHPQLGTLEDLRYLRDRSADRGIELALDIAFQVTPDHPYVREHPEWFRPRPDGSIQHAENPPKKYEDIYPFDFESPNWRELWEELKSVSWDSKSNG